MVGILQTETHCIFSQGGTEAPRSVFSVSLCEISFAGKDDNLIPLTVYVKWRDQTYPYIYDLLPLCNYDNSECSYGLNVVTGCPLKTNDITQKFIAMTHKKQIECRFPKDNPP